jgi:hypothetical protein
VEECAHLFRLVVHINSCSGFEYAVSLEALSVQPSRPAAIDRGGPAIGSLAAEWGWPDSAEKPPGRAAVVGTRLNSERSLPAAQNGLVPHTRDVTLPLQRNPQCSTSRTRNRIVRELGGSAPSVHRRDLSAFTVSKGYDPRAGRRRRTTNR